MTESKCSQQRRLDVHSNKIQLILSLIFFSSGIIHVQREWLNVDGQARHQDFNFGRILH